MASPRGKTTHPPALSVSAGPGIAAALLSGRKTEMRVLPQSPVARAAPGDRVTVRESCIPARIRAGKVHATALATAELAIFPDGWRRHRDGRGERGRRPTDPDHPWIGAMHMPSWASRATLVIEGTRVERLQRITAAGVRAEGARPLVAGWLWRWPRPIPGIHPGARRAFAHFWDVHHSAPGECWADDPEVVVLSFRVETRAGRLGN